MLDITKSQAWVDMRFDQPANDSRGSLERLEDIAKAGTHAPCSLSIQDIQQVSFALSLYIMADAK